MDFNAILNAFLHMEATTLIFTVLVGLLPLFVLLFFSLYFRLSIPAREKAFLRDLFEATGGERWRRNDGWSKLGGWFADPSKCYGLTVRKGHVVKIDLYKNNLDGEIPTSIGHLIKLWALELGGNQLHGRIPRSIGKCRSLCRVNLPHNQLEGEIPREIRGCRRLEKLILSGNHLTGPIPKEIGEVRSLRSFIAYGNALSGAIPPSIGRLKRLYNFIVNNNELSGALPKELGNCENLENFDVGANSIGGTVPKEICGCAALVSLYLYDNDIGGPLPTDLGRLKVRRCWRQSGRAIAAAACLLAHFSSRRVLTCADSHLFLSLSLSLPRRLAPASPPRPHHRRWSTSTCPPTASPAHCPPRSGTCTSSSTSTSSATW